MKYLFYFVGLPFLFIACASPRPSGYVQVSPSRTIYVKPGEAKKVNKDSGHLESTNDIVNTQNTDEISEFNEISSASVPTINHREQIITFAKSFEGTRYKYGGTTRAGMDCSGLICTAFEQEQIRLPRSSRDMAKEGYPISLNEVVPGDLVFFKTTNRNVISHVGLVVDVTEDTIHFIHATTTAGVIISSLKESYWNRAFTQARRVI